MRLSRGCKLAMTLCLAMVCNALAAVPDKGPEGSMTPLELARKLNQAFVEVAERVSPSVVVVRVASKPESLDDDIYGHPIWEMIPKEYRRQWEQRRKSQPPSKAHPPVFDGRGSGIVLTEDGYILTNAHVVENAEKIRVRLKNGGEFDAEIKGRDKQSDLAVLKIEARGLPVARFGDSSAVRVGEFAIAIGAPFELDYSVTFGHISAKGRSQLIPDPAMDQDFLQTDANINPGNSGGPLVNIEGEVIGVNSLIHGLHTGIGFAIPSNLARDVAQQLIRQGKVVRPWLGVAINAVDDEREAGNLSALVPDGVVIKEVHPRGPAASASLRPGDVITEVGGKPVKTPKQLRDEIRNRPIGKPVALKVWRSGKLLEVQAKPDAWPEEVVENGVLSTNAPGKEGPRRGN